MGKLPVSVGSFVQGGWRMWENAWGVAMMPEALRDRVAAIPVLPATSLVGEAGAWRAAGSPKAASTEKWP